MRYTYFCRQCGEELDTEEKMSEHGNFEYACKCGAIMEPKITGGQGFQLQGCSWGKDGYVNHGCCNSED
jgi:predicted nucleic acid-binding Zn ribbon protein